MISFHVGIKDPQDTKVIREERTRKKRRRLEKEHGAEGKGKKDNEKFAMTNEKLNWRKRMRREKGIRKQRNEK